MHSGVACSGLLSYTLVLGSCFHACVVPSPYGSRHDPWPGEGFPATTLIISIPLVHVSQVHIVFISLYDLYTVFVTNPSLSGI